MFKANKYLNVPWVVRPEDMANPELDEQSGMAYLSYFIMKDSPCYHATLSMVQSLLNNGTVNNFDVSFMKFYLVYRELL